MISAVLLHFLLSPFALAADCPATLKYKDGSPLKNGDTFYYASGAHLRVGDQLSFPDRKVLRKGQDWFYPGGAPLRSGSTLYYPDAKRTMKMGNNWYYADGKPLRSGEQFLYKTKNVARSSSILYRQDGTATIFPIGLDEAVGTFGYLSANVEKNSERIDVVLTEVLGTSAPEVASSALVSATGKDGSVDFTLVADLRTGYPGEIVRLRVGANGTSCELGGAGLYPSRLVITSGVATVDVRVYDSENVEKVRDALQDALQSLR